MKRRDCIHRDLGLPVVAVAGQPSSVPLAAETLDGLVFLILSSAPLLPKLHALNECPPPTAAASCLYKT